MSDSLHFKCYSNYFINKQNVRCYGNIMPYSALKSENNFLENIFVQKDIVDLVKSSNKFVIFLTSLKNNMRKCAQDDYRRYFMKKNAEETLKPVSKEEVFSSCWKALNDIIPKGLIGNNHNMKIFKNLVHYVVHSMNGEHISVLKFTKRWNYNVAPWSFFNEDLKRNIFTYFIEWIMKYLLAAMISLNFFVTTCKIDNDEKKLNFFYKNEWQSFYDRTIYTLIHTKVICKSEHFYVDKVKKRRFSASEYINLKKCKRKIPKLHIVLKSNNTFRPIVRYRSEHRNHKIKERKLFLNKLIKKTTEKFDDKYSNLHKQWLNSGQPKLYFVKTDLSNAFGSINRQLLMKILCELHMKRQKEELNLNIKKKMAQQYKDLITDLRKALLVRCGSTVYEWKEGLVQGFKYSPALSEIYYSYLDEKYFSEILEQSQSSIHLFTRVVDDYLFITESLDFAFLFLKAMSNYKNVNYQKTEVNFEHPEIKFCDHITFLGYQYDTSNLQVGRAENVYCGQICYKIAFSSAVVNLTKFLESRIGQSSIPITGHIFNLHYNNEELIWKHVFTTLCLSANKFCTILAILCEENDMFKYLNLYKRRVAVKLCNSIIGTLMQNKPPDVKFYYCINHFRYLAFKALLLCAQQTTKCNNLVPHINDYLAKSDCIFGKWRDHACRINPDGICQRKAVREICRKFEFKNVTKNFEKLPNGYQCYGNKNGIK